MTKAKPIDEDDTPPGDEEGEPYRATGPKRGGGSVQFLWFATADQKKRPDQIFQVADIRRMEAPADLAAEVAFVHFSGISVALSGVNLRRVLHRIAMHRCVSLHELRPGQALPAKGEPVIRKIEFFDMTKATPKPAKPN